VGVARLCHESSGVRRTDVTNPIREIKKTPAPRPVWNFVLPVKLRWKVFVGNQAYCGAGLTALLKKGASGPERVVWREKPEELSLEANFGGVQNETLWKTKKNRGSQDRSVKRRDSKERGNGSGVSKDTVRLPQNENTFAIDGNLGWERKFRSD